MLKLVVDEHRERLGSLIVLVATDVLAVDVLVPIQEFANVLVGVRLFYHERHLPGRGVRVLPEGEERDI